MKKINSNVQSEGHANDTTKNYRNETQKNAEN